MKRVRNLSTELSSWVQTNVGVPGAGDVFFCVPAVSSTSQFIAWLQSNGVDETHYGSDFPTLYNRMVSGRNDVMYIYGGGAGISLSASQTLNKNMCHFVGSHSGVRMNHRSRISQSAAFEPMFTLSGYGNTFSNLYIQHGTDSTTNKTGFEVTGNRNAFYNVHFCPQSSTMTEDSGFVGEVNLNAVSESYFKRCVFGSHSVNFDEATTLLTQGQGNGITIVEDTLFFLRATDTDAHYITFDNTTDTGWLILMNVQGICDTQGTPAEAIEVLGAGTGRVFIDSRCSFGCTKLVTNTNDGYLRLANPLVSTDDDVGYLNFTPTIT